MRVKEPLKLNVLVEMAVGDGEFRELLMRNPLAAVLEYNRQMAEELNPLCNLPRNEIDLLVRVAGSTTDFRQFCRLIVEERERMDEAQESKLRPVADETGRRRELKANKVLTLRSA
jgi:hypothetical protein